jgi:hypothetical protein
VKKLLQRKVVLVVAGFLLLGSTLGNTSKASAGSFPGVNGRLMYTFITSSPRPLISVNPDGTGEKQVLVGSTDAVDAKYSANGLKITYVQTVSAVKQIFTANADGTNPQKITNGAENAETPSWSPDGTKIIFSQTVSSNKNIVRMNADGTNQTTLTSTAIYLNPEYSPDGTKIVAILDASDDEVVTMNADGSNIVNLTNNSVDEMKATWSPTGNKIAYSSNVSGSQEIFTMNADGSGATQLTSLGGGYRYPQYSPDGTKIAFIDSTAPSLLYVMKNDGTNLTHYEVSWPNGLSWQPLTIAPSSSTPNRTIAVVGGKATIDIPQMYTDTYGGIDNATVAVTSTPTSGTTEVNATTGLITYTPRTTAMRSSFWSNLSSVFFPKVSAAATDSFTYRVCSVASSSLCSTGTVTVNLLSGPNTGAGQPDNTSGIAMALTAFSLVAIGFGIHKVRRQHKA